MGGGALPAFALSAAYFTDTETRPRKRRCPSSMYIFLTGPTFKAPLLLTTAIISVSCPLERI